MVVGLLEAVDQMEAVVWEEALLEVVAGISAAVKGEIWTVSSSERRTSEAFLRLRKTFTMSTQQ